MVTVKRFEQLRLDVDRKDSNGYLRAKGALSRVGVFKYRRADGSEFLELRPPDEVFNADSVKSFDGVPLTDDHPSEPVSSTNVKTYGVGMVMNVRADGDLLIGDVVVTHKDTVDVVELGKQELSCGYFADLDMTPGVWKDANGTEHRYDAIQRNIRGNHVAIVMKGRAGPRARLLLDASDAAEESVLFADETAESAPSPKSEPEKIKMAKLTLDGVEFEVQEGAESVIASKLDALSKEIESLKSELTKAKADSSDDVVSKKVQARLSLLERAKKLGLDKCEGTDVEIMTAALKVAMPKFDAAGKSDEAIAARFEIAVELTEEKNLVADSYVKSEPAPKTVDAFEEYRRKHYGVK